MGICPQDRRGCQIPWNRSLRPSLAAMRVLGIKPTSSGKTASVLLFCFCFFLFFRAGDLTQGWFTTELNPQPQFFGVFFCKQLYLGKVRKLLRVGETTGGEGYTHTHTETHIHIDRHKHTQTHNHTHRNL